MVGANSGLVVWKWANNGDFVRRFGNQGGCSEVLFILLVAGHVKVKKHVRGVFFEVDWECISCLLVPAIQPPTNGETHNA